MSCKCLAQFEEHLVKTEGAEPKSITWENLNLLNEQLYHRIRYRVPGKKREFKTNLTGQFCPFCGKKIERKPFLERTPKESTP